MGRIIIKPDDAATIKKRLWNGETQSKIAADYKVSITSISLISTGDRFHDIEWPDGSKGELSPDRITEIHLSRYEGLRNNIADQQLPETGAAEWDICKNALKGSPLLKDAKPNSKKRKAIQLVVAELPPSQRTRKNIERLVPEIERTL